MARPRKGRIFQRGKQGRYYLQTYLNGKQIIQLLRTEDGEPITNREEAERARQAIMGDYMPSNIDDLRRKALEAVQTAEERANAAEELVNTERQTRDAEEAHANRLRLADAWPAYLSSVTRPDSGEATLRQYGFQWNAFLTWMAERHPGAEAVADVTAEHATTYTASLVKSLSAGTVNKHIRLLRLVFRVVDGDTANPFAKIQQRKERQNHRREIRPEMLRDVFDAAEGEVKLLLFLGLYTGQRLADCCLLTWDAVDLRRGANDPEQVHGWIELVPRKTSANGTTVTIPVVLPLYNMLAAVPEAERTGFVLPELAAEYQASRDRVTDRVQALLRGCGVEIYRPGTGPGTGKRAVLQYGFHSLRHSTATILQEAGAPAAVAEAILGHRSPAMRNHYTHVGRAALAQAMAQISDVATGKPMALPEAQAEPERGELSDLAKTADIETVRAALAILKGGE